LLARETNLDIGELEEASRAMGTSSLPVTNHHQISLLFLLLAGIAAVKYADLHNNRLVSFLELVRNTFGMNLLSAILKLNKLHFLVRPHARLKGERLEKCIPPNMTPA